MHEKAMQIFLNKILWCFKVENVQNEENEVDLDIANVPTNNKLETLQNIFKKMTRKIVLSNRTNLSLLENTYFLWTMEDKLINLDMEDDINIFANRRTPHSLENGRVP